MSNRKPCSATQGATSRLKQDYLRLKRDPIPYVEAEPLPSDILEWHYVVSGPENSPYQGGFYHGKLIFPRDFPFKPPAIYMMTPSGRFQTHKKLCLSISDFHPDTWNPAWSVSTILTGLLSFMMEKSPTLGSVESSEFDKRQFAYQSLAFNLRDSQFCELFPDTAALIKSELAKRTIAEKNAADAAAAAAAKSNGTGPSINQVNYLQSCLTNLFVLVGFAAFAFTVKYIMKTTENDK